MKKQFFVYIPLFFLIGLFTFIFLSQSGCGNKKSPISDPQEKIEDNKANEKVEGENPVVFKKTRLRSREENGIKWELTAENIRYFQEGKTATAEIITCIFFDEKQKEVLTLTAKGAEVDIETSSLRFDGEVLATTPKGETLTVQKLRWNGASKQLEGESAVKLERDKSVLTAETMTANPDLNKVEFDKNVQAKSKDGETLSVGKLRWDGEGKKLVGEGSVRLERKNVIMTARRVDADIDMENIQLTGDVKVFYPDVEKVLNF